MAAVEEPAGLQNERTALAWRRTALACLVAGAFVARHLGGLGGLILLLGVAGCSGIVDLHAHRRYDVRTTSLARGRPVTAPGDIVALTAIVLLMSAIALTVTLT